ncbi:hypothetical protein Ahy_B03g067705 [Arachis hypogaea]|uniref:Uncharacterized protein n=1 Tax=Arachis hypogaea TaxID=3818 RepID=A0A445A7T0_ARAHY|nr:hypothetical protein Ahy_B03g067705 [Arachis hypogaea]
MSGTPRQPRYRRPIENTDSQRWLLVLRSSGKQPVGTTTEAESSTSNHHRGVYRHRVQFGWALPLTLLTPYVHLLFIPQASTAYILFCGPISGMLVHPIVGNYSDR